MKKQSNSIFWLLGIVLLLLTGCSDKSAALVKTWKLQDLKYSREVPKEMQASVDKSLNEMRSSFSLTYNADGTYNTKMSGHELQGKWKLNWNSSKITSTTTAGEQKEYTVLQLTNDKFSFEAIEGQEKVTFVMIPAN